MLDTFSRYSEMSARQHWFKLIFLVLITALISSVGTAYVTTRMLQSTKSAQPAAVVTPGDIMSLETRLKQVESALAKKDMSSGEVTSSTAPTVSDIAGNGEGEESPFIRQMTAHPTLVDFPVCRKKPTAKQRIGCNAQFLATYTGLVEWKFGEEMRPDAPNTVAFHIEKDAAGNIKVVEYAVSKTAQAGGPTFSQIATYNAAQTVAASHFIGPMDGTTTFHTAHMYMFTG